MDKKKFSDSKVQERDENIKQFLEKLSSLDSELEKMSRNLSSGLENLSVLKFENNEAENRLSTRGYTIGPAYTTLSFNKNQYNLERLQENPLYYEEEEILKIIIEEERNDKYFPNDVDTAKYYQENNKVFLQTTANKDNFSEEIVKNISEEDIYSRFGMLNKPPRIYSVKKNFDQALENILSIVNILNSMR